MSKDTLFYVGLDTHKETIAVAVCVAGEGEPSRFIGTIRNDLAPLLKVLGKLGAPQHISVVYEAGPTGYGLYRALRERGYGCTVIAPSLTPHRPGDRVKTDRRDSEQLARLWRAGELTPVWIPEATEEAMRDLWRAREDARDLRLKTRQQLKGFLLRLGHIYTGTTSWTKMHERWLAAQHFAQPDDQLAFEEYVQAQQWAAQRLQRLDAVLEQRVADWRFAPVVAALRALRGIDTLSAIGLVCEIGDIHRFASARALMAYLGLVPTEYSSGEKTRRGSITKTGNAHARRLLVEAAWGYHFTARMSQALKDRNRDLPEVVQRHAWKAQERLCGRFAHLTQRGVQANKICVAVARELAGFVWAVARLAQPASSPAADMQR